MTIVVTADEVRMLVEALDSHAYWQLSEPQYRRDGFVMDPGADDPEVQREIGEVSDLALRLEGLLGNDGATE
jgi:hypothetical protein